MSNLETLWREKTDDELIEGMKDIGDYTDSAQRIIRQEFQRRGLSLPPDPEPDAGAEGGPDATEEDAELPEDIDPLLCVRCQEPLDFLGSRRFHEGTNWGVLGELGEFFVKRERFDIYVCPRCGKVEFFVDGVGEDRRPQG
jgi:hypothetical protein